MRIPEIALGQSRVMLFPFGRFEHPQHGTLVFDGAFADRLIDHYQRKVLKEVVPFVDQDHDEGKAAGWFRALVKQPEGVYADIEWTPLGAELLKKKLYRYFSPWFRRYKDEETGRVYWPVLYGAALTNVPFLKMLPEVSLADRSGREYAMTLRWEDLRMAEWTQEFINNLPDQAFAVIAPGGERDEQGKTVPRDLRSFPHHTAEVSERERPTAEGATDHETVDLPHLQNALARLDQADLSEQLRASARQHLQAHAAALGVGEAGEKEEEEEQMTDKLRTLLGLKADASEQDVEAAVVKLKETAGKPAGTIKLAELVGLKAEASAQEIEAEVKKLKETAALGAEMQKDGLTLAEVRELKTRVKAAEDAAKTAGQQALSAVKKLADKEITETVDRALREGKIVPKQRDWARTYAERDFDGFQKFLTEAEPVITFTETGFDGEGAQVKLSDLERRIAKQIGLSEEDLLRYAYGVTPPKKEETT